ncbi:vomeronasal type-2 receptor 26 [Xenopus tropicalis]|uniref:Vomeronasal type-2 receptor 26 n=1 Tax=Xenopus tropicalis TaxID=8364 RepID=A0A8J1IPP3_XENTR|nr:vomeronasal type-2 receptor 26 [Xenopus tropicalis]
MYAIEEINNSTELLPNITLGYRIYDACTSEVIALMSTFSLLSEEETPAPNYICQPDQKLVAFVGHLLSSVTYTSAEITQLYGYPQLNYYLKNIRMKMASKEEIFFTKDGNIPGKFDILNWVIYGNGTIKKIHVGRFFPTTDDLVIHEKIPTSFCTQKCSSGQRRAHQTGRPPCCFDCVPCSEGEISNSSELEICVKCPDDHWSNPTRNRCIKRIIDFLSYEDLLGYILSACASLFIANTAMVLLVLLKHRRTPIVRANNQKISYILLMALLMSFLCTFMFIGRPTGVTCLLRQALFVCVFSVAISSILGKTMTVLFAFKSTETANRFRKWGKMNISMVIVFLCSFVEFVICVIWLTTSPPYVESDIKAIPGKIILQCNEGSVISFYLAVSYIGVLSLISFAVAFIARKLPDRFNEAQHITFSMLVFCSVWASFIPTYLSTKGKHMVAVEIFAIQASAAGMLMCIFTPKCYIILLKPELNVKANLTFKRNPKRINK